MFPKDDTYQAVVNMPGRLFLDIKYLRSQFTWDIKDNLRFVYSAGLEDQDRESAQDMEQSLNAWDQALFFLPGTGSKSWTHEVQLQSYGNKNFNWIAGVNYFHEKTKTIGYFDNAIDEKSLFDQPDRSTNAGAFFAQGTYSYSPKWHLTIGYRYSDETKEDKGGNTYICNVQRLCLRRSAPAVDCPTVRTVQRPAAPDFFEDPGVYAEASRNDNKGSWSHNDLRVGLDYQKNDNTLLYGYLATGFKSGGIGDVFEGTVVDGDLDENGRPSIISPRRSRSHRRSIRKRSPRSSSASSSGCWTGSSTCEAPTSTRTTRTCSTRRSARSPSPRVASAAGHQRGSGRLDGDGNLDVRLGGQPPFTAYFTQNVPGAQIQGFELEYDSRPWTGGRIHGYVSWLDTEITEDWITKWDYDPVSYFGLDFASAADAANERLQVNLKGNELAVSPPFKLHVTVDHAFFFDRRQT